MLAYLNDPAVKQKYLDRVHQHREADELLQGHGYWNGSRGCAVGCTIHGNSHAAYEKELGIPESLAHLEDRIFENLTVDKAMRWPQRFLTAIEPGADLSLVCHRFLLWLLADSGLLSVTEANRKAIDDVADCHRRVIAGEEVSPDMWSAARASAWAAARASAAAAAAWASAAAAAAWAARAAAESARSVDAAWTLIADKLIAILEECKP